uniref:DDT domain-containing protein n=1 Tax=Globodera rostochiensis TaxID=31243 RepID=A0A914HJP6_GLORO
MPPPPKKRKQYLENEQQQQHRSYENAAHSSLSSASTTTTSTRGRGRGRPGRGRGRDAVWHISTRSTVPRAGRRRSARSTAGRTSRWKDDSASVASSTGKRGKSTKAPRQPPAAAAKTKRPWEGTDDDEDDGKRYGFGRSSLFSEEEDYEEDEEENDELESDLTESDSDAEVDPKAVPSSSAPFACHPDYEEDEEDFLAELSPEQIPPLILSDSSVDLLIYKEHLMDTLEVYEVLKNYGSILQLSPFLFEDFCAAIRSPKQSRLLCEIHLAFMRLFFREEESEHTIFAATETTVSVNIIVHLMDSMNFAEVLRHYVESDPLFPADVLHILESSNYPFVELDKRLRVLKWMCERFFEFDLIKRIVGGINKTKHDEQCRSCGKMGGGFGKLLACAECEAVYHVHCDVDIVAAPPPPPTQAPDSEPGTSSATPPPTAAAGPATLAEDDPNWRCPLCRIYVSGITDENCLLPGQISHRNLRRITPVGKDRHGRLYWFMVRRIFVQDLKSGELYYYSTLPQLFDLINHLDPLRFERRLCRRLTELLPSVAMQMHATLELTDQRWRQRCAAAKVPERCPSRPYLHSDNVHRMSRIIIGSLHLEEGDKLCCTDERQQFGGGNGTTSVMKMDAIKEDVEDIMVNNGNGNADVDDEDGKKIDVTTSTNDNNNNTNELLQMVQTLLCIKDGHLVATFWSAGMSENQLLDYGSNFVDIQPPPEELLAQEGVPPPGPTADDFWWWRAVPQEVDLLEELNQRLNRGFRLGFSDGAYLQYVNHYAVNPDLCRSQASRKAERDKRKYLSSRFSLTDQGEFSWHLPKGRVDHYGTAEDVLRCVRLSLRLLVERIPDALMHRRWVLDAEKANFRKQLDTANDIDSLRHLIMLYEAAIRRPVFLPVWWQSLAATRFNRITSELRERRQLLDNVRKKEEKALQTAAESHASGTAAASGVVWVRYSLYGGVPPRHQLWRTMKDEQYRVNGLGALGGWLWVSSTLVRKVKPMPKKPVLPLSLDTCKTEDEPLRDAAVSLATRKSCRLERVAKRLLGWRTREEFAVVQQPSALTSSSSNPSSSLFSSTTVAIVPQLRCYSANCRLISAGIAETNSAFCSVHGDSPLNALPCYSPSCARNRPNSQRTRGVVKAKPVINNENGHKKVTPSDEVLGEQKAFPFPQPQNFGATKRSILKLPKWFVKRLARQGGMNPKYSLHFFHQTAKSNPTVWPYPCVRPLFFHCWRYLISGAQSLHALALRFRLLYACIRWADMEPDPDDEDPRVWSHQADYDEVRMVVSHRENPPDGYYEQYLLKVDQYMVEDGAEDERCALFGADDDDSANYRQSSVRESGTGRGRRTGGRKRQFVEYQHHHVGDENGRPRQRQRASTTAWRAPPRRVRTLTRWIDGVDLKLYEISWYWSDWLRNKMAELVEQRRRKALEATVAAAAATTAPVVPPSSFFPQQHHQQRQQQQQMQHHNQPQQHQRGASFREIGK